MTALARLRAVADAVSTRPAPSSYIWNGKRSLLAWTVFHFFYVIRVASPLQWVKYLVRRSASRRLTTNVRPDFPSLYTELYFLILALTASAPLVLSWDPGAASKTALMVLGSLFLLETFTWIFYYLLIRAFVEGRFTIFHPAEYLLTLPVVLVAQVLLVHDLSGKAFSFLIGSLTVNPSGDSALTLGLAVLGLVYVTITIVVLMSSYPAISTRPSQRIGVLGAGDVTTKRILPALKSLGYGRSDVKVATIDTGVPGSGGGTAPYPLLIGDESRLLAEICRDRAPTIVASPTYAHFAQIVQLAAERIQFAVEKPIVSSATEREILRRDGSRLMENGFALSYYTLEKALPLTYILQPLPVYEPFLECSPAGALQERRPQQLRDGLGGVKSVRVVIHEGSGRSPHGQERLWTQVPGGLRPFVETTIHPLLIIRRIVGAGRIEWGRIDLARNESRLQEVHDAYGVEIGPTYLAAEGVIHSTQVSMSVGKYLDGEVEERGAIVDFAHGRIVCNFDTRDAWVELPGQREAALRIRVREDRDYKVVLQLFAQFALKGWGPIRFDDFEGQLDALDWWDDLCAHVAHENTAIAAYDQHPPARAAEMLLAV